MGLLALFTYDIIDREYCNNAGKVYVDVDKTIIYGVKEIRIWDDHLKGFVVQEAFYISYHGIEYGSFALDWAGVKQCCSDPGNDFMIFENYFEDIFE